VRLVKFKNSYLVVSGLHRVALAMKHDLAIFRRLYLKQDGKDRVLPLNAIIRITMHAKAYHSVAATLQAPKCSVVLKRGKSEAYESKCEWLIRESDLLKYIFEWGP
jgi:hypothetical protein